MRRALLLSLLVSGCSILAVRPAPSYDPWMWLLWGHEVVALDLSTVDGPAFKPLPVAVCAALAPLGPAAPWLWVLLARSAAALAVVLAFRLGRRLADGSVAAGALAALGVALCGHYLDLAAAGSAEGLVLALALAGTEAWRRGRPRWALACGIGAALVRVETWPFLLVAGVLACRRCPRHRNVLLAATLVVPAAWLIPELVGSGDVLRSLARAQVPNPGQPALAAHPVLASLRAATALPLWPLWVGVALTAWMAWTRGDRVARAATIPAAIGLAWIGLVAAMTWAGFSGEPRYALPGAALLSVSGAAGLVRARSRLPQGRAIAAGLAAGAVAAAAVAQADDLVRLHEAQAYQWALQSDLPRVVEELGGAGAVLACGRPYVGPWRGPLMAHQLGVPKHAVEPDHRPEAPGVIFRSALTAGAAPAPAVPDDFRLSARAGAWEAWSVC